MYIAIFIGPLILAILGAFIRFKKASWLIAGYNTATKAEKEKYDEEALCKFVGNLLFVLAGILFFNTAFTALKFPYSDTVSIIGVILFVVVAIAAVIYMNTGNRFKKKN